MAYGTGGYGATPWGTGPAPAAAPWVPGAPTTCGYGTGGYGSMGYGTSCVPAPTPPAPAVADVFVYQDNDTIRGGKEVVVYSRTIEFQDTSRDASFRSTIGLPAAWSSLGAGAPSFTTKGVVLKTTAQPGTVSSIASSEVYNHFDISVDFEVLRPLAIRAGVVDVAVLEFDNGAGGRITVEAQRGPGSVLQVRAQAAAFGRVVAGHNLIIDARRFTLRIVRNGPRAWAFYGVRNVQTRIFSELVKLLEYDQFVTTTGSIKIRADNRGTRADVQTRVANYTVEAHTLIGPRLLDNKRLAFGRVVGNIPAATLDEVGAADITAFGLFGEVVNPGGFEYTLPVPRTVGRERTRQLELYVDEQARDGEN